MAGALVFDEKIHQSAALFWFDNYLKNNNLTIDISPAFLELGSAKKIAV
jgi:hypothetical protein